MHQQESMQLKMLNMIPDLLVDSVCLNMNIQHTNPELLKCHLYHCGITMYKRICETDGQVYYKLTLAQCEGVAFTKEVFIFEKKKKSSILFYKGH